MDTKISGYTLLVIGIALIAWSVLSVYQVFTGKASAYKLFAFDGIGLDLSALVGTQQVNTSGLPDNFELPARYLETGEAPKTELVPSNLLNDTTNVIFHLMLMGFVASGGFKIASIGTMLVRPVKVTLREDSSSPPVPKAVRQ